MANQFFCIFQSLVMVCNFNANFQIMGQSKTKRFIEFMRVIWAIVIFAFGIFNIIYALENPKLTQTQLLLRFWKYWLIAVIIIAALEGLSNKIKD